MPRRESVLVRGEHGIVDRVRESSSAKRVTMRSEEATQKESRMSMFVFGDAFISRMSMFVFEDTFIS